MEAFDPDQSEASLFVGTYREGPAGFYTGVDLNSDPAIKTTLGSMYN